MQIIHRISLNDTSERRDALRRLRLDFVEPQSPLVRVIWFDICEEHPAWSEIQKLLTQWGAGDISRTKFTRSETCDAEFLNLVPTWHCGYPQPDDDFGYLKATYDLSDFCQRCGRGAQQKEPFRILGEPKFGKNDFLQLNWVFDELFVRRTVWNELLQPLQIASRPVIDHRTRLELKTVVQLVIPTVTSSRLIFSNEHSQETCADCQRTKYTPITRGFFPSFDKAPQEHLFRTQENFGSGASSWRAVIASQEFYKTIVLHNLKGLTGIPLRA